MIRVKRRVSQLALIGVFASVPFLMTNCDDAGKQDQSNSQEQTEQQPQGQQPQGQGQQAQGQGQQPQGQMNQAPGAEDIDDEKLEKFAEVNTILQSEQQKMSEKMVETIESNDVSVEDYQSAMQAQQNPDAAAEGGGSDISEEKMNKISGDMQGIREGAEEKYNKILEEHGLTIEEYQTISMAVRQNKDLQDKLQKMDSGQ